MKQTTKEQSFKDLIVKSKRKAGVSVVLEYIGEALSGDFNPEDPEDEQLIRFTVYKSKEQVDDGSYCTLLRVTDGRKTLRKAAKAILSEAEDSIANGNFKKIMEWMSHISINAKGKIE